MKRTRLAVIALLAIVLPSLSQVAEARPVRPGADIIGGTPAATGEFPFMAAILDETRGGDDYNKQFCGGSLIAPGWVLTAAHCAQGAEASQLSVAVGRTVLSSDQGQRRGVSTVVIDPLYGSPTRNSHDAALLQLSSSVTGIGPIGLAGATDDGLEADGVMLTVIGWGTLRTGKQLYPDELYKVNVPVVDDAPCIGSYGSSLDAATEVCAGGPGIDSCYGDSGGPLFANSGSRIQVGIVSWGNGCAKKRFPGVYSEVNNPDTRDWIARTAGA